MTKVVIAAAAKRNAGILFGGLLALLAATLMLSGPKAAPGAGSDAPGKIPPVKLESLPGTNVKRVVLTAKAAERLGIETGVVREEIVVRKQMVGGQVVTAPAKSAPMASLASKETSTFMMASPAAVATAMPMTAAAAKSGEIWVRVPLTEHELSEVAHDQPVRVLALAGRDGAVAGVVAQPSKLAPVAENRQASFALHYVLNEAGHALAVGQRVRVELSLAGSDARRKVLPYAAVLYDVNNQSWAYTNLEPLVFERQRIEIESIEGNLAILSSGPPAGTQVVIVGAMLLYGAETLGR